MKKSILFLSVIILGLVTLTIFSCNDDSKETCQQDEICTDKSVTACCTNDVCIYKYNGKEYSEEEVDELAIDLGCGSASLALKSANINDLKDVVAKLKDLMTKTRQNIEK